MNPLAARLRLTEGQLYSVVITLTVAVLLLFGLGGVHGVVSTALATPELQLPTQEPGVAVPTTAPTPDLPAPGGISIPTVAATPETFAPVEPAPEPAAPAFPDEVPTTTPTPSGSPKPPPTAPCAAKPVVDAGTDLLTTLNTVAGGRLPDKDLEAALGIVTGCDPADPAVVAVGILIGLGESLPDPGIDAPVLPTVDLPPAVVTALQPLRDQIDTVCGVVGTGNTVASLFISAYPRPVSQVVSQALFQSLLLCGQLRTP